MNGALIGRVRKIAVEKKQAYYQPQVTTGKRRQDRLLVLGGCTHLLMTSAISLVPHLSGQTQRHQCRKWPAVPVLTCDW